MQSHPTSPFALVGGLWQRRQFMLQLARQEIVARYRGSWLGLIWSFLTPIVLLAVYTFVFSVVFKAKWGNGIGDSKLDFALILFGGLIVYNIFAESVNRAPGLIIANANYVKKVVFPLETLPVIAILVSLFHAGISFGVLIVAQLLLKQQLPVTVLFLPLILLPLLIGTLGVSWIIASLGVYIRDIAHMIGLCTTSLLFLTPVMYPVSALPVELQGWLYLNPLTYVVEQTRAVLIFGQAPDMIAWCKAMAIAFAIASAGYWWFQRTRKGFADVL